MKLANSLLRLIKAREAVPILDCNGSGVIRPCSVVATDPGMAVFENGRMIAHMTGFYIDEFWGPQSLKLNGPMRMNESLSILTALCIRP